MSRRTILFLIVILGNIFGLSGFAQKNEPSGLALEIKSLKGRPPDYLTVSPSADNAKWAWFFLFNRIPNFKDSADRLPVKGVKFVPYLEKDLVKINVSVYTGLKFNENEETVGIYSARENERITIKELADFGVEPFEITVIRVAPSTSILPSVVNKTNSLQVTGLEPSFSTLPSYKIKLLNTSEKAISAFTFETKVNGKREVSGMPSSEKGEPLIKPGEVFEKVIPNVLKNQKSQDEQIPSVQTDQTFIISSVVFNDGSYEGDAYSAARIRAFALGKKLQLQRLISFIQFNENKGEELDLNNLAEQATKLEASVNNIEISELLKDFPSLNQKVVSGLVNSAEMNSDRMKREFIKELEMQIQKSGSNSIFTWLNSTKEQYQNWIKGLP